MSEWTVDTLHEHLTALLEARHDQLDRRFASFDERFSEHLREVRQESEVALKAAQDAIQAAVEATRHEAALALSATEKAVAKTDVSVERRFEVVNEYRVQLDDQAKTFLTRAEYGAAHQSLIDRLDAATRNLADRDATISDAAVTAHAGIETRLSAIGTNLDAKIGTLSTAVERINAQRTGSSTTVNALMAALGLLASIIIVGLAIYAATKR